MITDGEHDVNPTLLAEGFSFSHLRQRLGEYP
jgi:hypothetical protein